jgi:hypothetical protein
MEVKHNGFPQKVKREKLNNGCYADELPHEYGCLCEECDAAWLDILADAAADATLR